MEQVLICETCGAKCQQPKDAGSFNRRHGENCKLAAKVEFSKQLASTVRSVESLYSEEIGQDGYR